MKTSSGQIDNSYQGPYTAQQRKPVFAENTSDILGSSKERDYFPVDVQEIYNAQGQVVQPGTQTTPGTPIVRSTFNPRPKKGQPMYSFEEIPYAGGRGYNEGGEVHIDDGGFIVSAREAAEIGKGSFPAAIEAVAPLGGIPLIGPGDGTSDSIPARIGGTQEARVASGEIYFPYDAVERIGGGDHNKGTKKLYALMRKAEQSRKKTPRGEDGPNLLRGLA
jgi:hypothetical protein